VPFPDELARGLAVVAYDRRWPGDFAVLARRIHGAPARDAWSDFKQRLAAMAADIYQYGQAKAGPTEILMIAAESWARQTQASVRSSGC
jgi:hypothetical protein